MNPVAEPRPPLDVPGRLNAIELASMDSRLRRWSQRLVELPVFEHMLDRAGIDLRGARLLEIGCGNGNGLRLLDRRFAPRALVGIDPMPEQIDRALRTPGRAEVRLGDVTRLELADASFDAIFVFGVLHHVPKWTQALAELRRVLVPGGALLIEEIVASGVDFSDRWLGTSHPPDVRLTWPAFRRALAATGFKVLDEQVLLPCVARSFLARRT